MNKILQQEFYKPSDRIQLGAEGDLICDEQLLQHPNFWQQYLQNLRFEQGCFFTTVEGRELLVEFEFCPLMARSVFLDDGKLYAETFPGIPIEIRPDKIYFDDFDRFIAFHKKTDFPIGFMDAAQNDFFNLCDEFTDDSYQLLGQNYPMLDLMADQHSRGESFWTAQYQQQNWGWDLGQAHPYLQQSLDSLKLMRAKVLVLGCGRAHDAHYFAERGHLVDAIDISAEALTAAQKIYPETSNLKYFQVDALNLPDSYNGQYDIVWDHTFYCAIPPKKRQELVKIWHRALNEQGRVMGIFFSMFKPDGPPFGGSEWELRARVKKQFRTQYWNRVPIGPVSRLGKEFFCILEKRADN